jgi:hypothetical protein
MGKSWNKKYPCLTYEGDDDDEGINQSASTISGEKGFDARCVLMNSTRFADRLDVRCERKTEVKDNSRNYGLTNWKDGEAIEMKRMIWKTDFFFPFSSPVLIEYK